MVEVECNFVFPPLDSMPVTLVRFVINTIRFFNRRWKPEASLWHGFLEWNVHGHSSCFSILTILIFRYISVHFILCIPGGGNEIDFDKLFAVNLCYFCMLGFCPE